MFNYWAVIQGLDKHADFIRVNDTLIRNPANNTLTVNAQYYDWAENYLGKTPRHHAQCLDRDA